MSIFSLLAEAPISEDEAGAGAGASGRAGGGGRLLLLLLLLLSVSIFSLLAEAPMPEDDDVSIFSRQGFEIFSLSGRVSLLLPSLHS